MTGQHINVLEKIDEAIFIAHERSWSYMRVDVAAFDMLERCLTVWADGVSQSPKPWHPQHEGHHYFFKGNPVIVVSGHSGRVEWCMDTEETVAMVKL